MLNTPIHKKSVCIAVILCVLTLALATIWPMRRYTEDHIFSTGPDPVLISDEVTEDLDTGEYFTAQYDHLQTLEFYVSSVTSGPEALFQLFHVTADGAMELTAEETVTLPEEVPGYAAVPVDADLTVGDTYVCTIRGVDGSRFTVGFSSADEAAGDPDAPAYQLGFYNDTGISGVALQLRLTYRTALTKLPSLALACFYAALGLAALFSVWLFFRLCPRYNTLTTVLNALRAVLTPVILAGGGAAFLSVWPFCLFDSRIPDILIYETGILLAVLMALYALWHDPVSHHDSLRPSVIRENIAHYAIIVCIALIMSVSADYMNATSELVHNVAMHRIVMLLSAVILLMGTRREAFNRLTAAAAAVSAAGGVIYCVLNRLPRESADYELGNAVLRTRAAACVLALTAAVCVIRMLAGRMRGRGSAGAGVPGGSPSAGGSSKSSSAAGAAKSSHGAGAAKSLPVEGASMILPAAGVSVPLTAAALVLAALLLIFRNTRLWIPLLLAMWAMFYLRYRCWAGRGRFLKDLCEGILLDFACKVIYSMLHRYYMAYRFSRFSMHFHTVTVTAYYLVIVCAAALTLFAGKWRQTRGLSGRARLAAMWKETVLLGFAGSYMVMSLTRSGIGAFAVLIVIAALFMGGGRPRTTLPAFAAIALTIVVSFPVVFTGQRLISTVYDRPERFEELETYDDWLVRNVTWNCTRFMNIEVFLRDFGDRILGGEIGSKLYYGLEWNVPQGNRTARMGEEGSGALLSAASDEAASGDGENAPVGAEEGREPGQKLFTDSVRIASEAGNLPSGLLLSDTSDLESGSLETGDISNGRLGLYLAYLRNLNLTGHDVMGVELSDGEIALHAHNTLLQVAYDCGIPTGVVFLAVLLLLLGAAYRCAGGALPGKRTPPGKNLPPERGALAEDSPLSEKLAPGEKTARANKGSPSSVHGGYELMPLLLLSGCLVISMVEWIFHFCNPCTIAVLFAISPLLFPEGKAQ